MIARLISRREILRCIAATTALLLFAAATNALAPVASMATKSKKVAMIKCLNNKFSRNTEQAFKKKHTGLGWGRAVNLVDTAIELQHSLGRL